MAVQHAPMRGSFRIATFAGIGVYVHWTFLLLPALVAGQRLLADAPLPDKLWAAAYWVALILAIFACVVLHEFGHALTAKRYGVKTRDIVLLPIGGVARLERIPRNPVQELWIALAGPAVNVVIAAVLSAVLLAVGLARGDVPGAFFQPMESSFLASLMTINIVLVVFNMIPAFPMDGGRVLRALLAMRLEYARATSIAAHIGQLIAVLFLVGGLFTGHILLMLVAVMVFLGAGAEAAQARLQSSLGGLRVRDAMLTGFRVVAPDAPLRECEHLLLSSEQSDFPVVEPGLYGERGRYVGILTRARLVEAIRAGGADDPAARHAQTDAPTLAEHEDAVAAVERMQLAGIATAPVLRGRALVGLVTIQNIADLLDLRAAHQAGDRPPPGPQSATV